MPKLPSLGGPTPDQPQEMDCAALNAERTRLLAERDDLKSPLRSSPMTEAQRDAELTQLNGKLYTVAKGPVGEELPGGRSAKAIVRLANALDDKGASGDRARDGAERAGIHAR
jgi:hypothetical protein